MADLYDRVEEKIKYLQPRYDRMDEDMEDLYLLADYEFADEKGKTYPDSESITTNNSGTFADKIMWLLSSAVRHWDFDEAEKDKAKRKCDVAEEFIETLLRKNTEVEIAQSIYSFEQMIDYCTTLRGQLGGIALLEQNGEWYYPDFRILDGRAACCGVSKKDFDFVCFSTSMTGDEILRDYQFSVADSKPKNIKDIWTPEKHIAYMDKEEIKNVDHKLGFNPAFMVEVPTSPLIANDGDAVKNKAESVYAKARKLYSVLNRHMSAWATQNMQGVLPPRAFRSPLGRELDTPISGVNQLINLESGEDFPEIKVYNFSQAHQAFIGQILAMIQRATMGDIDYGNLNLELSTATVKRLQQAKDQLLIPRLVTKNYTFIRAAYLILRQYTNTCYNSEEDFKDVGIKLKDYYDPADFRDKNFVINCHHYADSPENDIANMTIAANAKNLGMSKRFILGKIFKLGNVDAEMREGDIESAKAENTLVRNHYQVLHLLQSDSEEDNIAAELLANQIGWQLKGKMIDTGTKGQASAPTPPTALSTPLIGTPKGTGQSTEREELRQMNIKPQGAKGTVK